MPVRQDSEEPVRPPARRGEFGERLTPAIAPRFALSIVAMVFAGFLLNSFTWVIQAGATPFRLSTAFLLMSALMFLQLRFFSNPDFDLRSRAAHAALLANALLIYGPALYFGQAWIGMAGFLAGNALLVLRPGVGWTVFAAVAVSNGFFQIRTTGAAIDTIYATGLAVAVGLIVYGLSRLRSLVRQQQETREQLATLAVAQERLRFARDLHDLLGFSLSAITLKAELAHRFILTRTERARTELAEILVVSRQALADVRAVASSYRELSLDDEIVSAQSVLTAAEIDVSLHARQGELPARVRTVLATVLREGVTNVLRHSKAEHCSITLDRFGADVVVMELVNDGVRAVPSKEVQHSDIDSRGIGNLGDRVRALGGTITAGSYGDNSYRLHIEIPLARAAADTPEVPEQAPHRASLMAPHFARAITYALFTILTFNSFTFVINGRHGTPKTVFASALLVVSLGLMLGYFSRPGARVRSRTGYVLLGLLTVLTYLPIVLLPSPFVGLPGFLAGAAALVLPYRVRWVAFGAVAASVVVAQAVLMGDLAYLSYSLVSTLNIGLEVYAFTRMRSLVQELHETRSELASLAVTQERLRFARDLHDLLGFSLSAITLKSELTQRLADRDPARAGQELSEILEISRQALADIRAVASSYRELSLDEEITSARSVLDAADVDVTMRLEHHELPADVRTALATVLREGVTNLLRHSRAARCEIVLACTDDHVTMDIVNDGVGEEPRPYAGPSGSGIQNLTTRIHTVGGTLRAGVRSDKAYHLHAEIPLRA